MSREVSELFVPLVERMAAWLAERSGQTLESADAIAADPLFRDFQRQHPTHRVLMAFRERRIELVRPKAMENLNRLIEERVEKEGPQS